MNITCPTCEDEISVEEELFNTEVECPYCSQSILLQSTQTVSMFEAIRNITVEGVKQAIADGADVNAKDEDTGNTPLHSAVAAALDSGRNEVVELLMRM